MRLFLSADSSDPLEPVLSADWSNDEAEISTRWKKVVQAPLTQIRIS
jgi:hypothetical protein